MAHEGLLIAAALVRTLAASSNFDFILLRMQAKSHGQAGYGHAKAGAEAKKEGAHAEGAARKDAAHSEYHQQK